jgi:predicted 3-demethylubiquinone-9 3-methyltransferase (glyoxalase superfamily)
MTEQMYPCLWFDGQARAAADFYCNIFPNSKLINDSGMVVNFELNGQFFMGLNGGGNFQFNEAVSFVIPCKTRRKLTIIGTASLLMEATKVSADGVKTSSDYPGK